MHRLVLPSLLLVTVSGVRADLLVVALERGKVLTSLREFTLKVSKSASDRLEKFQMTYLLHTLTDVPVDEGTFGVQEIELVVKTAPGGGDGGGVGQHAERARDLGQVTARDVCRGLVADTELEAGRAPVDELDCTLGLDETDSCVSILRNNVTTVKESAGHC